MGKKFNGYARWIIVIIAVAGIIFNTAILYNDVKNLKSQIAQKANKDDVVRIEGKLDWLCKYLLKKE